jgi:glycosyltransferase involved in cell wall biosynthesis
LQQYKVDVLQIEQEPTAASILPLLKKLSIPLVLDFHAIWAEELVNNKVITRNDSEYSRLQNLVSEAVSTVDAVLVESNAMKNYVMDNYGSAPSKIHVIGLPTEPKSKEIKEKSDPPRVIYAGSLSQEKHCKLFLESIPHIARKYPSTEFYMTNRGDLVADARAVAKASGASINLFWFPTEEALFKLMMTCNIGIITLPNNISTRMSLETKFFDYLSTGLPVVCNNIGGWTSMIEEEKVGILTKDDPVEFSKGILKFIENPAMAREYGQRGLNLVKERHHRDRVCWKLSNLYLNLLNHKSPHDSNNGMVDGC